MSSYEEVHRAATVLAELHGEVLQERRVDRDELHPDNCACRAAGISAEFTDPPAAEDNEILVLERRPPDERARGLASKTNELNLPARP